MKPNPALRQALDNITGAGKPEPIEVKPEPKSKVPEHRETPSEHVARVRDELKKEREKLEEERQEQKVKEPKVVPTREEELRAGYVKAKLKRGYNRKFEMFTLNEWRAMSREEQMKYMVMVSNDPANQYTFHSTGKAGKGRGTVVRSSLSHPRRF